MATSKQTSTITETQVRLALKKVIDPELGVNIVDLGLIYKISTSPKRQVHIVMTLTTPGCPLAGVFDGMVRDALNSIQGLDTKDDVTIDLTFDPPWITDMMDPETRAQLGFDDL
jgi:metal-sulfur cluster biosynthetic enzyme